VLALTACQATKQPAPKPVTLEQDPAVRALKDSASRINEALLVLKEKENAKAEVFMAPEPNDPKLKTEITMRAWNGPAKKAVEYIGLLTGYRVATHGTPPAVEPLVALNVVQVPAHRVLQNIGIQIGDTAGIQVRESIREITLVYVK
jgi:hypothetical protein